jgi:3-oxoacyl-[acyl-carrier-protein] synthase II
LVSAHATATPNNDSAEFAALQAVFGDNLSNVPVVAFKSHLGHTLGGAGAVELVLSVLAREREIIPPTANATPRDPACDALRLTSKAVPYSPIAATLGLSLGFGGSNASIVVTSRKPAIQEALPDDAVITGVGVILPGAVGNDQYRGHLRSGLPPRGGPVPEEEFSYLVNSRRTRRMSDYVKLTLAATTAACEHAGIDDPGAFAEGASVVLGTMHGSSNFCESYYSQIVRDGVASANPALFAEGVPNAAAAQLSLMLGVRGGCQTIIGSCTSGIDALGLAAMRIREGKWNRAFVGAGEEYCETVNRASVGCLDHAVPVAAGSVTFVLESRRAALARNARILCTLLPASTPQAPTQPCSSRLSPFELPPVWDSTQIARTAAASRRLSQSLPQCYSVGPMAALAAAILDPGLCLPEKAVHNSLAIQASDPFCGVRAIALRFVRETG